MKKNTLLIWGLVVIFILVIATILVCVLIPKSNNKNTNVQTNVNESNENVINSSEEEKNVDDKEITLTSEQAFKLIESKRKSLNYDTWSTLKAKVLKKGDNNYFWVTYTEANVDGGNSSLEVIFHYENGSWNFDLPGFSGTTKEAVEKYNFVDIDSAEYFELNDDLAYALIEGKRSKLGYDTWTTSSAKVLKKGDNDYFYVTYIEANADGGNSQLSVIFHYENGSWNFEIPGFSAHGDLSQYNFVDIQ